MVFTRSVIYCLTLILCLGLGLISSHSSKTIAYAASAGRLTTSDVIRVWQSRVESHPQGYLQYLRLADVFVARSRETGDVSDLIQAETAVQLALQRQPNDLEAQALLAQILYSLHQFPEALSVAQPLAGNSIRALAILGDVQMALGDYDAAQITYRRWADRKPSPSLLSRQAALADATGDPETSLQLLRQAIQLATKAGEHGEPLAWHHHQLGLQLFLLGRIDEAETHFRQALQIYPNYYLAQAGLGRVSAARLNYSTAIEWLQKATDQIPQPDLVSMLGDLYALSDQPQQAQDCYDTVDLIGELAQAQQQVYNRQLVYSWVDHNHNLEQALELALAELEIRHDVLTWDAAAWASYKNGKYPEAQKMIEKALTYHTQNPILFYHAGLIAQALNHPEIARDSLIQALNLNPHFDPLQSLHAQDTLDQFNQFNQFDHN